MSQFVDNRTDFAVECLLHEGRCEVVRENILFLDENNERDAVSHLQLKCGYVVITPDRSYRGKALLYHTSCQRMTEVVKRIFQDSLEAPESFPQPASEMTLGELYRRGVSISYDDCRAKVEDFSFEEA